jgi:hypothetical protein
MEYEGFNTNPDPDRMGRNTYGACIPLSGGSAKRLLIKE